MKSIILISAAILLFSCGPNDGDNGEADARKKPKDSPSVIIDTPSKPVVDTSTSPKPTILLDFDGHKLVGTSWNNYGDQVGLTLLDAGFTEIQQNAILSETAKAFEQFGIVVTSQEPVYLKAPVGKKVRVILTNSHQWYGTNAGGVAYPYSFLTALADPCFVFTDLIKYNVNRAAKNAIHEAGHTLGLRHQSAFAEDGRFIGEYSEGNETEAPHMGFVPLGKIGKWWIGPIAYGAQYIQNDTALIWSGLRSNKLRTPVLKPIED